MNSKADRPQPRPTDPVRRLVALTAGILLAVWMGGGVALYGYSQPPSSAVVPILVLGAALLISGTAWVYFSRGIMRERASAIQDVQDRRCRLIVDMAADAILTFTHEGRIESANPAATRLFGYALDEMIGRDISLLLTTSDADSVDALLRKELKTGSTKVLGNETSLLGRHKAGHAMPIELGTSKVIDEDRRLYIQIVRDLTDRKPMPSVSRISSIAFWEIIPRSPTITILSRWKS